MRIYFSLFIFAVATAFLSGCASSKNAKVEHTLQVMNYSDANFAVYIDSLYIGRTPIKHEVISDTLDGKKLRIVYKGSELKSYTLHKDSFSDEVNERQKTATAIGSIAAVAGMVLIPYPIGLVAPLVSFIPAIAIGNPRTTMRWEYKFWNDSFPELKHGPKLEEISLPRITRRWFVINWGHKIPSPKYRGFVKKDLINSSGVCFDEPNETVWFESEDKADEVYPIPIRDVTLCLDTVVTEPSFFGMRNAPVVNEKTCGYWPTPAKTREWFQQYPCEIISRRKQAKTDKQ
ncbi:hypothetical protein [uncultured Fibrobacter sp.]|uniref:hypothetical protein n=1 Tax=uncultured Fibrobacter sp. TaxID=261512 RepID=UPI0025DD1F8A|nr:hypothetical protein [uncultured Fibrobacter sp.]